jgi:hypothetical protein
LWTSVGSRRAALAPVIMGCHFSQDLCMMTQSIIQTGHGWATTVNFRRVQVAPVQLVAIWGGTLVAGPGRPEGRYPAASEPLVRAITEEVRSN